MYSLSMVLKSRYYVSNLLSQRLIVGGSIASHFSKQHFNGAGSGRDQSPRLLGEKRKPYLCAIRTLIFYSGWCILHLRKSLISKTVSQCENTSNFTWIVEEFFCALLQNDEACSDQALGPKLFYTIRLFKDTRKALHQFKAGWHALNFV